jgi:hypothetical protein
MARTGRRPAVAGTLGTLRSEAMLHRCCTGALEHAPRCRRRFGVPSGPSPEEVEEPMAFTFKLELED